MTETLSPKTTPDYHVQPETETLSLKIAALAWYVHEHPEEGDAIRRALAAGLGESGATSIASKPIASVHEAPAVSTILSSTRTESVTRAPVVDTQPAPVHDSSIPHKSDTLSLPSAPAPVPAPRAAEATPPPLAQPSDRPIAPRMMRFPPEIVAPAGKNHESESSNEKLNITVASYTKAKESKESMFVALARGNEDYKNEARENEDYKVVDTENGIFAVFDGMGGQGGNPAAAAQAAGNSIHNYLLNAGPLTDEQELGRQLFDSFKEGREAVTRDGEGGSAVGTVMRFAKINGETVMGIAHAGDTRVISYDPETGKQHDVTPDQSTGFAVHNGFFNGSKGNSEDFMALYKIKPGSKRRFMICSDGITGDFEHQFLSKEEFADAFGQPTPDASAQRFMELSKKIDDKTIIILDVVG